MKQIFSGPIFSKEEIPKSFLSQHEEHMKYILDNYLDNTRKFKFYDENPGDSDTAHWELIVRLMPRKFIEKFKIENIPSNKILSPQIPGTNLCTRMSKLKVDFTFDKNENCNLASDILKDFDDKEMCDQLSLIFEKFKNTQELLSWPYETEDRTVTNLKMINLVSEYGKPIERVRKTMFITPASLYRIVANIEEKYDLFVVEHFPQNEISCAFDDQTVVLYKFNQNHGQSEREFLIEVFNKWEKLRPKKIVFKNMLFLTHFSTSFLRIIASFYKYVSVNLKGIVEIDNLKPDLDSKYIQDFWDELNGSSCHFIMCFAELQHVNKGDFFEIVTNYNSQLLMQYIIKSLDYLIVKSM